MKCEGKFNVLFDREKQEPRPTKTEHRCEKDAKWRITFMKEANLGGLNVCDNCLTDASPLSILYSAVRLEKK